MDDEREAPLRPDASHPVHRHDIAACELAIGGSSSTVAVATRQKEQRHLSAVLELAVLAAAYVALGAIRPRWTTLLAALPPALLAFVWLLLHEDIPGDKLGFIDLVWYVGMSLAVGGVYALASAGGVVLGRGLRRLSGPLSR